MKRRIVIEVDYEVFPEKNQEADRHGFAERLLALAVGNADLDFVLKAHCHNQLKRYGVTIIKDEQI